LTPDPLDRIRSIRDIPALIAFLRDDLDWPIGIEDFDELTFEYEPEELGIDAQTAARIEEIKQLRPLAAGQPWGVFFIRFEPKRLPVVVLRRILSQLIIKKRASAQKSDMATWNLHDLLFISNYGEGLDRQITFAHFTQDTDSGALPTLKVLGWDDADTALHISHVYHELKEKLRWPDNEKNIDDWRGQWSSAFTLRHRQVITTSKDLAVRLADLARRIRRRAGQVLAVESERGPLRRLHKAFRESLIHDLSEEDFADMYAQTIAYGLLAARLSRPMGIIAENVADMVPVTNPFLKDMLGTFLTIGGRKGKIDFDELGIQDIVDLLNSPDTHMEAIMRDFGNRTRQEDPVIHFYELFLAEYDKKVKVKRGVFYTPQPVVSYIVRSVHELLQTEFGLADGLADTTTWGEMVERYAKPESSLPSREGSREGKSVPFKIPDGVSPDTPFVQILDPATGTATFLVEVIDIVNKTMTAKWRREGRLELELNNLWNEYVPKHLLPRLFGYELLMAPYAIAHMKIGLKLYETGYTFQADERAHVYLTNALEPPSQLAEKTAADLFEALGHEAKDVNAVKRNKHFTVVIGNPPYSYESINNGAWISRLIKDYYSIDGQPLGEHNPKGLQDDYVKFIRFAQWQIATAGCGVHIFITNHSYIDNPTFRGMRRHLMATFSEIYLLDLHGNSKKKEHCPDNTKDENVFDIQQGVAIGHFVKKPQMEERSPLEVGNNREEHELSTINDVRHAHLWGLREVTENPIENRAHFGSKYNWCRKNNVASVAWAALTPQAPFYLFSPQNRDFLPEYEQGWKITEMMPLHSVGISTSRDHLSVHMTHQEAIAVIRRFISLPPETARQELNLVEDSRDWQVVLAQNDLKLSGLAESFPIRMTYRPFDDRFTYYTGNSRGFHSMPRPEVMQHMIGLSNLALCTNRQVNSEFRHVFVSRAITDGNAVSLATKERTYLLPLYSTPVKGSLEKLICDAGTVVHPNLSPQFLKSLALKLGLEQAGACGLPNQIIPEDIFYYIYAVFHSPTYRTRYAEFLKIDFPRLPLTSSLELFHELAQLGGALVALHLVESPMQTGISIGREQTAGWTFAYATPPPVRISFNGPAEPVVEKVGWSENAVWIDAVKPKKGATDAKVTGVVGFRGVPEKVWSFHIGGYQVCEKWLKDRKGRTLSADDLVHYHRIVVALSETIRIMADIDAVIDAHGGWPLK